jgi:hypothetical protein
MRQLAYLSEVSPVEEQLHDGSGDPFVNDNGYGGGCDGGCHGSGCGGCDGGCYGSDYGCCDGSCDCGGGCCGNGAGCAYGDCSGYGDCCGYGDGSCDYGNCCDYGCQPNCGMYYTEVQLMFIRTHLSEFAAGGKLSEQHEIAPRLIFGYEAPSGLGGRVRYWTYDQSTANLTNPTNPIDVEMDVIDLEGTSRFCMGRTDLVIAGGFRWLEMTLADSTSASDCEMPGITFAADLRSAICCGCSTQWSAVCGARWSLLGGDWENQTLQGAFDVRDDNMLAQEIYGGVEYVCHHCGFDLYARLVFEVQNWRSDFLGSFTSSNSIGFCGPGAHVGLSF